MDRERDRGILRGMEVWSSGKTTWSMGMQLLCFDHPGGGGPGLSVESRTGYNGAKRFHSAYKRWPAVTRTGRLPSIGTHKDIRVKGRVDTVQ